MGHYKKWAILGGSPFSLKMAILDSFVFLTFLATTFGQSQIPDPLNVNNLDGTYDSNHLYSIASVDPSQNHVFPTRSGRSPITEGWVDFRFCQKIHFHYYIFRNKLVQFVKTASEFSGRNFISSNQVEVGN